MTTVTIPAGPSYVLRRANSSEGVSPIAIRLTSIVQDAVARAWNTTTGQRPGVAALPALSDSYREAEVQSVHGGQSLPVPAAMREAAALLEALPTWCAVPAPMIEPSGAIAFEWDLGPHRWLVFALKGIGTIEHSAMIGRGVELHGTANFTGSLGKRERDLLRDLMQFKG